MAIIMSARTRSPRKIGPAAPGTKAKANRPISISDVTFPPFAPSASRPPVKNVLPRFNARPRAPSPPDAALYIPALITCAKSVKFCTITKLK